MSRFDATQSSNSLSNLDNRQVSLTNRRSNYYIQTAPTLNVDSESESEADIDDSKISKENIEIDSGSKPTILTKFDKKRARISKMSESLNNCRHLRT